MPIDPTLEAASLVATPQEFSPAELQNRYGARHQVISNLAPEKFLTILAIQTPRAFSEEEFFDVLSNLRSAYDIESIQTVFAAEVPDFGTSFRNNLYLTAHLRCDQTLTNAMPEGEAG